MGVDSSYGKPAPLTTAAASKKAKAASAALRAKSIARTNATTMSPIAKVGRFLGDERVSELIALMALAGAGIAGARAKGRTSVVKSGARPMTAAERSATVTKNARKGVGYIGQSIKPREPIHNPEAGDYPGISGEPWSSYDSAYSRAEAVYRKKYGKGIKTPSQWSEGYAGPQFPSYYDGTRVHSPNWALKTAAGKKPVRTTAKIKPRGR